MIRINKNDVCVNKFPDGTLLTMLLIDYYKAVHAEMLPEKITKSVSYFTPRMSRVARWDKVVMFGLQGFIKTYLIDYFNKEFFERPFEDVIAEYKRVLDHTLGEGVYGIEKIEKLHRLGYLPIEIVALPEGTRVPVHVPMFGITNTHPDFAWLPQALESLISAESWHPMIAATVGYTYREIVNRYYDLTCDDGLEKARALGAFDFRGEECTESAIKAGAGWCLSFLNTATVPVIPYLEQLYCCDCTKEPVAFGSPSTEHAVMCSNYAVDGDEITFLRRLLTEIYPNTSVSVVLDPHVKAIYGDSITVQRCERIYDILEKNGFACSNVALGVGSFSFQCIEEDGILKPFTRDTFSSCIKATYCEIDGKPYPIFKDPKDGGFKKSQKGCCVVSEENGELQYRDELNWEEAASGGNLLQTVFKDGVLVKEQSLREIRNRLHAGAF